MKFKAPNRFGHLAHSLLYDREPTLGFCLLHQRSLTGLSPNSFMDVVKETVKRATAGHDRVALRAENNSYNYAQIVSSAWSICNHLCSGEFTNFEGCKYETFDATKAKLESLHGVRIGIVAKPSAEFVAGVLGTWLSGGVVVPLALSYPETELMHVMNDSEISMVLSTQEHQELMEKVASKCYSKISLLPSVTSAPTNTDLHEPAGNDQFHLILKLIEEMNNSRKVEGDDPALILYTSGTTGKPKGVVHTHKGIISQVQILSEAWEYRRTDRLLNCLPLHHVHGLFNALLAPLYAGAVVEFMPKFSVRGVWQRWRESYPDNGNDANEAITLFTAVPTIYSRLLQGYEAMDLELKAASASAARRLRLMMCGSSALPYPLMKQWEKVTGQQLLERYGMTEFVMALANPLHGIRKAGTVGKPLPQVEAKIIGEDGTIIERIGELCIRSPSLFKEYWKQPKVTKESFIDGGFFKTGDTVSVDEDGYYTILGRSNADIMKVGGYKLSALEIEAVLLEHPAVSECCVLGLQDKYYGEVVCAVIVPLEDVLSQPAFTLEELQEWSKERLAPYKIPTKLFLWDALPRNAMGKVNKKEIQKGLEN